MGPRRDAVEGELSALPSVHELADRLDGPHALRVKAARQAIDEHRAAVRAGADPGLDLVPRAREVLSGFESASLRSVLNATGVIIHTNLGRAPLAPAAKAAVAAMADGYSNLELDLDSGRRGSRQAHVEELLCELTGAEAAIAVNNGAAAVLLAAAALAGPGRAIAVSRGQLVEIGGGFRIPEVVAQSGSQLLEVGTTNRTRLSDYERALRGAQTPVGAILRVHQSNFRTVGFVEEVAIDALCELGVPVIDDVGSGVLADPAAVLAVDLSAPGTPPAALALAGEPAIRRSVAVGSAVVCCSGDKLLGGPQAGLMLGRRDAIAAARSHPLARAVRIDKLSLGALEATLLLYRDPRRPWREIPALAMLAADEVTLAGRAQRLARGVGPGAEVVRSSATVGGGALPLLELEGPVVALVDEDPVPLVESLRDATPPLIARIHDGRVLLDPRTMTDEEVELAIMTVRRALGR
ncbi:MAG: L-seryl-tRNA(Sec) selenium transferase [Solirubrobacteraceae bacterium]